MKLPPLLTLSILVFFALSLAACNMPNVVSPTPDLGLVFTQAAQTATALPTTLPPTIAPTTIVVTQVPPTPTVAIPPTATSTSVPTATPSAATTPTEASCSNQVEFVSDVTIPDDTEMLVGEEFIKTWRLKNIGTCTWTSQYAVGVHQG